MKFDAVMKLLMPKNDRFRTLLRQDTENLRLSAAILAEVARCDSVEQRRLKVIELRGKEHEGDQITRQIFEALNKTFITPLDREDIRSIASGLDDILDFMDEVAQYLVLFELSSAPEALVQFADILVAMTGEIDRATGLIWDLSAANAKAAQEAIVHVSDLENQADSLYNTVIAGLFKRDSKDSIVILKWKVIYDGLESACDACTDYAHALGNVVIKTA
jgi:predicted phosphate transport protein (TIGR00153 family)